MWWAAVHRGYHHRYSDKDGDQHSPVHGKWHAFNGWIHTTDHSKTSLRSVVDLGRIPMIAKTHKYYELIIYATWIIAGCISLDLLFWGFVIPAIVALHIDNAVNLFCHLPGAGYRNFETTDQSVNVPILGYLGWGQGWHNNHHAHASRFDFGRAVSGKKWEYDPCMLFVPLIAKEIR
jgi:stearoyl-CoA desaturase (delta-9 desaturase)